MANQEDMFSCGAEKVTRNFHRKIPHHTLDLEGVTRFSSSQGRLHIHSQNSRQQNRSTAGRFINNAELAWQKG